MISASEVSKLRTQTGAGMMDCKNALEEAGGDMEKAAEILRKKGIVKAAKRADKVAADGLVTGIVSADGKTGVLVEVNCETDFVAKSEDFKTFSQEVAKAVLDHNPADVGELFTKTVSSGSTIEGYSGELTLKIGEKVSVRRFERFESTDGGHIALYLHGTKIGAMVEIAGGNATLANDIAMHVAATNPKYLDRTQVPADVVEKEKEIYAAQLRSQKKPENIIENILKGKIDKFLADICLVDQQFIKNEDLTVEKLTAGSNAKILRFVRFELGEGIEKVEVDFAEEVAAQLK